MFVDLRKETPSVEIPKSLHARLRRTFSDSEMERENSTSSDPACLQSLKSKKVVPSKEIASVVKRTTDNRLHLPLGHNMMVAFSRSPVSTYMNRGGRPVVDGLAKELVHDMFSWNGRTARKKSNRQ